MPFVDLVKETRQAMNLTQGDVALRIGVSQGAWSRYESRELPIPVDVTNRLTIMLKNPRIKAEYAYYHKGALFNVPVLNNVDDNPIVVIDSLMKEARELIEHCEELKKLLRNKRSRKDLSNSDWERVLCCEEQIADMFPALKLHFIKMVEVFDLDLERLEKTIHVKLKTKKYIK